MRENKIDIFLTVFDHPGQPSLTFHPGQEIAGTVKVEAKKEEPVLGVGIFIEGYAEVRLSGGLLEDKYQREIFVDFEKMLVGDFKKPTTFPAGVTDLSFEYQLQFSDLPCSYDGDYGSIEYSVKAVLYGLIDSPSVTQKITMDVSYPLRSLPNAKSPVTKTGSGLVSVWCCKCRLLDVVVTTDRYGYDVTGDVIELEVTVNNKSWSKVLDVTATASLVGTTIFKAEGATATSEIEISEEQWGDGVLARESSKWKTQLPIPVDHPGLKSSHFGKRIYSVIDIEWSVRVIAEVKGHDKLVEVSCPIILGTR